MLNERLGKVSFYTAADMQYWLKVLYYAFVDNLLVALAASSRSATIVLLIICLGISVRNAILVRAIQQKLLDRFTSFFLQCKIILSR